MGFMIFAFIVAGVLIFAVGLIGVFRTRRALHQRDAAVQAQEALLNRLKAAIELTPIVAMQAIDHDEKITLWNQASEHFYGHSKEGVMGKSFSELLFPAPERRGFHQEIERVVATRLPSLAQSRQAITSTGEERTILLTIVPIIEHDTVVELYCMEIDITRERAAQQKLEHNLQQMKSFCDLLVGREGRVMELKREINDLCNRLGEPHQYSI